MVFSLTECKEHYNEIYVNGIIGEGECGEGGGAKLSSVVLYVQGVFLGSTMAQCWRDMEEKVMECFPFGIPDSPSLPPVPPSPPHFTPVKMEHAEQLELGYMPLRDDFEKEHDNSAETLISGIMVGTEEEELEKALKLAHVDMYSRRLRERERRKR